MISGLSYGPPVRVAGIGPAYRQAGLRPLRLAPHQILGASCRDRTYDLPDVNGTLCH